MTDLYGNEEQPQANTPTITLQKNRRDKRVEVDSHFKLGTKVFPNLSREAAVAILRAVSDTVAKCKAEKLRFEFTIEEIEEAKK